VFLDFFYFPTWSGYFSKCFWTFSIFLLGVDIFPSVFGLFPFFRGGEVKF